MKKGCKKLFSLVLAIACLFSMNLNVLADTPAENGTNSVSWQVSKSKKASPTELSGTNKTTRVTLSLPSAEEELTSDVVFVLDSSSCSKQVITEKMPQLLQNLYSSISASKAKLNVGVVMFRGNAITAYPLQEYTGSIAPIAAAIANGVIELNSASALHGSNMPSGLDAAKAMLAASSTPGNRKHMILVGDGATYLYTHDEDPSTCFSRTSGYYGENGSLYEWHAKYAAGNGNGFPFPPSFTGGGNASDWNSFISSIAAVRSNFTQYDQAYVRSAIHPDPALTVPDPPVELSTFITNVEEALYQCVKEFTDMSASGISCYAVNAADGDMGVFTTFMNYLGSSLGKGTSTDFSNIEKNILYLFSSGSVTDTIDKDFDLVTDGTASPFTLTLGGTALSSVSTGTNEWSFGTPDANGTYPYVVTYMPGTEEKFTWKINVPVKNAEQLQLSYSLLLTASPSVTTTYPTNESASLSYSSGDGNTTGTETFEVPEVTYTPPEPTPTPTPAPTPQPVSWQVSKSKKASPTELSGSSKTTKVTLSLPSAEYAAKSDIVFLLDKSMSQENSSLINEAKNMVDALAAETGTDVKVGVVEFSKDVTVKLNLTQLTSASASTIKDAMTTTNSSGTNILGAVKTGEGMLAADTAVSAANKYLILLTDGGSTYYSDANGTPMHLYEKQDSKTLYMVSQYDTQLSGGKYTEAQYAAYNSASVQALLDSGTLANGTAGDKNILANVGHDYSDSESTQWHLPYSDGNYQTFSGNAAYVTQLEKSFYLVGNELLKAKNAGYQVISVSWPYHQSTEPKSQMLLCKAFMEWVGEKIGPHYVYDSTNAAEVMGNVKKDITYLIGSGSVTDTIGGDFNLVTNGTAGPFTLTLAGTTLSSVSTGTNEWSFGTPDANGVYPYAVTYTPGSDEKFTWKINVPVKNAEQLQLSYYLLLTAFPSVKTVYPTNKTASLSYQSSDGRQTGTVTFEVPTVTYTPEKIKTPAVIDPPVQKLITGDTPNAASDFTFILKAGDAGCPMPSGSSGGIKKTVISGSGKSEFGEISYSKPGTYNYTCYEVNSAVSGYTYDANIYTLKVVVTENDSAYAASAVFTKSDGSAADGFIFTNLYKKKDTSTSVSGPSGTTTPACSTVTPACSAVPSSCSTVPSSCSTVPSSQKAGDTAGTITPSYNTAASSPKTGDDSPLAALIALFFISALCIAVTGDKMLNRGKKQK
jgi:pilin isopeptide linkage protein